MRRVFAVLIPVALAMAAATAAEAQTRRAGSGRAAVRTPAAAGAPSSGRGSDRFSVPAGRSGTIGWNTPNASGNLGGPGAGGASTN